MKGYLIAMFGHRYRSTGCKHGMHDRCRTSCKFCYTPCRCRCHV